MHLPSPEYDHCQNVPKDSEHGQNREDYAVDHVLHVERVLQRGVVSRAVLEEDCIPVGEVQREVDLTPYHDGGSQRRKLRSKTHGASVSVKKISLH